ncbi:MAG TPA: hypothetical protein VNP92_12755 [Actinophytocola sp.]|nr:hypothetical protein [Actinophytocola sp.]
MRGSRGWHAAYRRVVRDAFATVPLYRERWALDGRTDPVLVPGRTGHDGGAIGHGEAIRRIPDLVPIGGGSAEPDPLRGLGSVLPRLGAGGLVVVLDGTGARPPADLREGLRGCVLDPNRLTTDHTGALAEINGRLRRGTAVLAVGTDKDLARLAEALEDDTLQVLPTRELSDLGSAGLLHDPLLGFLGNVGDCGRWHVDRRHVYVRETAAGLAFTVLGKASPRLVDILVGDGVPGTVARCPRHATPVLKT